MTCEKFKNEIRILIKFFSIYCSDKHSNQLNKKYEIERSGCKLSVAISLCPQCQELFEYAMDRLKECTQEPKPKCRHCPNNCYDIQHRTRVARVMRYAGVKTGLSKALKLLNKKP